MTRRLRKYPTSADVRTVRDQDWINAKVQELPSYDTTETLATFTGVVTPHTLHAWATFADSLTDAYPDSKIGRDLSIVREKTQEEKEETVIDRERSHRYYNPDEYADITEDEILDS